MNLDNLRITHRKIIRKSNQCALQEAYTPLITYPNRHGNMEETCGQEGCD